MSIHNIIKKYSRIIAYSLSLLILLGLTYIGFFYPFWESYKIAHPKPMRYEAREDAVPEIDMHPKFQAEDFYEGKLSYKNPSIINQLSPSSTIFIHSISWDTTTSGFIHTVGTMCYTPITVRAKRVHKAIFGLSSSDEHTFLSISSSSLSLFSIQSEEFHSPRVLSEGTTYNLSFEECYWK